MKPLLYLLLVSITLITLALCPTEKLEYIEHITDNVVELAKVTHPGDPQAPDRNLE